MASDSLFVFTTALIGINFQALRDFRVVASASQIKFSFFNLHKLYTPGFVRLMLPNFDVYLFKMREKTIVYLMVFHVYIFYIFPKTIPKVIRKRKGNEYQVSSLWQ